ncbi:Glycosyl transferase family protein [Sphingomonas paucimobilis]|nr:Glycosyl transferase family protein [Sphingomonas paucimobilis]
MGQPRFAVIVPVHNKERHVVRSLQSVLNQTLAPDEIIVVDDASTDGSMAALRLMPGADRITFLRRSEPGPGGYAGRNLGIETARAEWIAFLDADDIWETGHLASMAAAVTRAGEGPACIFTGYEFVEPAGYRRKDWFSRGGRDFAVYQSTQMLDFWLEGGCPLWTGAVAIKRAHLLKVGMFPAGKARRGGDRDLWLRTMVTTQCIHTGAVTAQYRRDADNMLTRAESFSVRQRVQDTVEELAPNVEPVLAERLRRIANREVFQYAFKAWKGGAPITNPMLEGFTVSANPARYALIRAMRIIPMPISQERREKVRAILARLRKRKHGSSAHVG